MPLTPIFFVNYQTYENSDLTARGISTYPASGGWVRYPHNKKTNMLFLDLHVAALSANNDRSQWIGDDEFL